MNWHALDMTAQCFVCKEAQMSQSRSPAHPAGPESLFWVCPVVHSQVDEPGAFPYGGIQEDRFLFIGEPGFTGYS